MFKFISVYVCIAFMHEGASEGQRRALNPLELVIDCCEAPDVDDGIPTLVICKSNKYS